MDDLYHSWQTVNAHRFLYKSWHREGKGLKPTDALYHGGQTVEVHGYFI